MKKILPILLALFAAGSLEPALYLIDLADDPYRAGDRAPAAKLTTDRRNAWDAKL